jgi:hypothetical protein
MENPDTVIELDREVVQELFEERLPPQPLEARPFEVLSVIQGEAHLNIEVSRVWFHVDGNGRRWRRRDGATITDLDRHLAFDLQLGDHPKDAHLENSKLVFTRVLGLPVPTDVTRTCNGREIPFNEIPLFGRLVIHDSLERVETTTPDGQLQQNIVVDFAPQPGRTLEAEPSAASTMFGPAVQRQADGRVLLSGMEPYVTWELTPSEQQCIRNTSVGRILRVANVDVIDLVAEQLSSAVIETLATEGDNETSSVALLPAPRDVDPTGTSDDPIQIDGVVRLWTREGAPAQLEESLQIQIQTLPVLPEPLPPSVLALSIDETVGLMQAGFAIERSIRTSQIASLCLDESDFDPDAGCLLVTSPDIVLNGDDATLVRFSAVIKPSGSPEPDVLKIDGRAEGDTTFYSFFVEFGLVFHLDQGDVPRDPLEGELPPDLQPPHTLAEISARLKELTTEACEGGDRDAINDEQELLLKERNALPKEIGVKPQIVGEPFQNSDSSLTTLAVLLGLLASVVLAAVGLFIFTSATFAVAVVDGLILGLGGGALILGGTDAIIDFVVSGRLADFVDDKKKQDGNSLPLEGYAIKTVLLKDRVLRVFLKQLDRKLKVRFFEPDQPSPLGDPDFVAQQVAGIASDGRLWRLTVADAAHLILKGRIEMSLETPDGREFPLGVAHSSRGRRYLRTAHDTDVTNNLAALPRIPTV